MDLTSLDWLVCLSSEGYTHLLSVAAELIELRAPLRRSKAAAVAAGAGAATAATGAAATGAAGSGGSTSKSSSTTTNTREEGSGGSHHRNHRQSAEEAAAVVRDERRLAAVLGLLLEATGFRRINVGYATVEATTAEENTLDAPPPHLVRGGE